MRGIFIGVWLFAVLLLAPMAAYVPVQAQSTANVTVTVRVRPPKISLNIHSTANEILPPARFKTAKQSPETIFSTTLAAPTSPLATILSTVG